MQIDQSAPVMVTGATGYVAGWIIQRLLEEGLTVHCTVRDPDNADKLKYLKALEEKHSGSLKFFKADLLDQGAYQDAMQGCEVVFHTASPFVVAVKDPQKDLVDPAVKGTQNVLEQANKVDSVKRVVLTSSVAAIYGDNADVADIPNKEIDESIWNTSSSLEHQAYSYSKTMAEKAAWEIHDAQSRWDMVVINPGLVIGPGINPKGTSESFRLIKQLVDGTMLTGAPGWKWGLVDVRDVAEAHIKAAFTPEAEGRHITVGCVSDFLEMAHALRDKYGKKLRLPKNRLPKPMVWAFGPVINKALTRKIVARNIGVPFAVNNKKSKEKLGISYRPMQDSMNEFVEQMLESGYVRGR